MADVKISALPAVVTAAGTDVFPVVQGGVTKQETLAQALTWIQTQVAPIPAGGTGIASYTIGDLLYASGATTLAKLADVAVGNALISGGIGVAPAWGKVSLTAAISGILPLANGGSGADLSATGGAGQYVKQASAGGVFTVGTIPAADIVYSGLTTGQPLRATGAAAAAFGALDLNNTNATVNALLVARGGTGLASYAIGDIVYADGATSLAKLADVATGNALISGGVTTAPAWGKIGLTTHVSGILPSANGGTGVNNAGTLTNATNTTITGGGTLALGGFTLTVPATGTAALLATANIFTATQAITVADAVTAATTTAMTYTHNSSGTPAANFGSRILYNLDSATVDDRNAAAVDVIWTTATDASRASAIVFSVVSAASALAERLRIGATGTLTNTDNIGRVSTLSPVAIALQSNGGGVTFSNSGSASGTQVGIVGSSAITTGQFVYIGFGAVETARFASESASASTAAVVDNLVLRRNPTSGTPASGTGQQIRLTGKSDTTTDRDQLTMSVEYVVATDASRTNRVKFNVFDTAAREALRLEASGSAPMIGFLGAAAVVRQTGGENLTNNVTSGGTTGQIDDFAGSLYATDAATIRNDIYQLARALKQDHDTMRLLGFLT